jgi:hypothetical protein
MHPHISRRGFICGGAALILPESVNASEDCPCAGQVFVPPGLDAVINFQPRDLDEYAGRTRICSAERQGVRWPEFETLRREEVVQGIIVKGTDLEERTRLVADRYKELRGSAKGLLWGSYHLGKRFRRYRTNKRPYEFDEVPGEEQALAYLSALNIEPGSKELVCLDYEETRTPKTFRDATGEEFFQMMTNKQVADFMQTIKQKIGRYPILNTRAGILNDERTKLDLKKYPHIGECKLWLCHYVNKLGRNSTRDWNRGPDLPKGFNTKDGLLWQWADNVTEGGNCAIQDDKLDPMTFRQGVRGVRKCDRNTFMVPDALPRSKSDQLALLRRFWYGSG